MALLIPLTHSIGSLGLIAIKDWVFCGLMNFQWLIHLFGEACGEGAYVDLMKVSEILGTEIAMGGEGRIKPAEGNNQKLTGLQIVQLTERIHSKFMPSLALGYMNLSEITLQNANYENRGYQQAFVRTIIRHWAMKIPGNQTQVKGFYITW